MLVNAELVGADLLAYKGGSDLAHGFDAMESKEPETKKSHITVLVCKKAVIARDLGDRARHTREFMC
jgi:hypothetical protein